MRIFQYDPFSVIPRDECTVAALRKNAEGWDVSVQSPRHQGERHRCGRPGAVLQLGRRLTLLLRVRSARRGSVGGHGGDRRHRGGARRADARRRHRRRRRFRRRAALGALGDRPRGHGDAPTSTSTRSSPSNPAGATAAIPAARCTDGGGREFMVLLELCRHPLSPGAGGHGSTSRRRRSAKRMAWAARSPADLVRDGAAAQAMADYQRYVDVVQPDDGGSRR